MFRIKLNLRTRILDALDGKNKSAHTMQLLGTSPEGLRVHLEAQFKPGMSWETYGPKGWHVDHIKPCASFDLSDPEQQRQCFHYTNLQPLWWTENLAKGDKVLTRSGAMVAHLVDREGVVGSIPTSATIKGKA